MLVTGAEAGAGRAVVARLARAGGEVRAYLDAGAAAEDVARRYRRWGVKVARGVLDDEGRLELALEQVHTVVHTGAGWLDTPSRLLDELASVVSAGLGAGCRRVVWLSHPGAAEPGDDPYLQACAEGELLLAEAPMETVVLRCALAYGPHDPLTALLADGAGEADARARHAPLYLDDLAAAVQAADAERGREGPSALVVELAGPDVVALGTLVEGLAGAAPGPAPVRAPAHLPRLLSREDLPGPGTLGRTGTPLAEGLARTHAAGGDPT